MYLGLGLTSGLLKWFHGNRKLWYLSMKIQAFPELLNRKKSKKFRAFCPKMLFTKIIKYKILLVSASEKSKGVQFVSAKLEINNLN